MSKFTRIACIILFTVFPVLFVYFRNEAFIYQGGLLVALSVVVAGALIIYGVLNFINHKNTNNVLIVLLLALWFLLYGHVYCFLLEVLQMHYSLLRHRFYFPVYTFLFLIPVFKLWKAPPIDDRLITILFITGLLLNLQFILPSIWLLKAEKQVTHKKSAAPPQFSSLPDVYYIITDSYPSAVNLKKYYHFDNSNFIEQLRSLNFQVMDSARSNYPYTHFSVPSSLNMEYINYFEDSVSYTGFSPYTKIHKNKTARYFQSKGYRYVLFQSGAEEMNNDNEADLYFSDTTLINSFQKELIELSVVSCLNIQFGYHQIFDLYTKQFKNLANTPKIKGNKFVFFHCLPPHYPLVFDANGNYPGPQPMVENPYRLKEAYIAQLKFVNITLLKIVKNILKNSSAPPIIIIQGDHGTCTSIAYEACAKKWPATPSKELLKERYGILNAIYLPQKYAIEFPKNHTPVNTFRFIINKLFNDTLGILPNKSYYARHRKPYDFREINWDAVNDSTKKQVFY